MVTSCSINLDDRPVTETSDITGNWFFVNDGQYEEEYISQTHYQFMLSSAGLIQETKYELINDTIFADFGELIPVSRILTSTADSLILEVLPIEGYSEEKKHPVRRMRRLAKEELGFYDFLNDSTRRERTRDVYYKRYSEHYKEHDGVLK